MVRSFSFFTVILFGIGFALAGCAEKKYVRGADGGYLEKPTGVCAPENKLPTSQTCVSIKWEKPATAKLSGIFVFKIWRPNLGDQTPVPVDIGDDVEIELWMPHMGGGHGSTPVTVEKLDIGTYRAKRVFFSMPGQWEIRVKVKNSGNIIDQVYIPFLF